MAVALICSGNCAPINSTSDVILITAAKEVETVSRLPRGIDAITLDKIRSVVQTRGDWSAEAVGEKIGASRTTARRYLEYLVTTTTELTAEVSQGAVGRPERRYRKKTD